MTRVWSGLAILPIVVGIVWYLPPIWTLGLAELVLAVALVEYADLSSHLDCPVPRVPTVAAGLLTCAAAALAPDLLPVVMMLSLAAFGGIEMARGNRDRIFRTVGVSVAALVYLAIPLGAVAALGYSGGRETVLLFIATVMASDTAQYYGGRAFGRRPLAKLISPGKTIEGALFGLAAGTVVMVAVGQQWLPGLSISVLALLGLTIAAFGIVGDLFESSVKRSASVKDASTLIPGHGGVLDRLDAFVFAVPVYYVAVLWSR